MENQAAGQQILLIEPGRPPCGSTFSYDHKIANSWLKIARSLFFQLLPTVLCFGHCKNMSLHNWSVCLSQMTKSKRMSGPDPTLWRHLPANEL